MLVCRDGLLATNFAELATFYNQLNGDAEPVVGISEGVIHLVK